MNIKIWLCTLLCLSSATSYAEVAIQAPQNLLNNLSPIGAPPAMKLNMTTQDKGFLRQGISSQPVSEESFTENQTRFHFAMDKNSKVPKLLKYGASFIARSIALNSGAMAPQESFGITPKTLNKAPVTAQETFFNIHN